MFVSNSDFVNNPSRIIKATKEIKLPYLYDPEIVNSQEFININGLVTESLFLHGGKVYIRPTIVKTLCINI